MLKCQKENKREAFLSMSDGFTLQEHRKKSKQKTEERNFKCLQKRVHCVGDKRNDTSASAAAAAAAAAAATAYMAVTVAAFFWKPL